MSNTTVPTMLMATEKTKPGEDRSIRYQRTGFARARVRATCNVDCHGIRRLICVRPVMFKPRARKGGLQRQMQYPQKHLHSGRPSTTTDPAHSPKMNLILRFPLQTSFSCPNSCRMKRNPPTTYRQEVMHCQAGCRKCPRKPGKSMYSG